MAADRDLRLRIVPVHTPTEASWLNLIEAQFGVTKRFTLTDTDDPSHRVRRCALHQERAILLADNWPPQIRRFRDPLPLRIGRAVTPSPDLDHRARGHRSERLETGLGGEGSRPGSNCKGRIE